MAKILNGRVIRDKVAANLKRRISKLKRKPCLVIIQIGDLAESNAYIRQKKLFAEKIGADCQHLRLPSSIKESELLAKIKSLNADKRVNGLIVQMPIPDRFDKEKIMESIDPEKDVDGLHSKNVQKLWEKKSDGLVPATARGVLSILDYYHIPLHGKLVTMVGCSALVGKPTAGLLLNREATIIMAHRYTKDLPSLTKQADIIVVATGVPHLIGSKHVKRGQVVIDVGINVLTGPLRKKKLEEEISAPKLVGDVDFAVVSKIVKAITPVPGGVGPMTVASLFENLLDAYERQNGRRK